MTDKRVFVERRAQGDYAVRRVNSQRASAVAPTQKAAINRAKELAPESRPHIARVRYISKGGPDQFRKE